MEEKNTKKGKTTNGLKFQYFPLEASLVLIALHHGIIIWNAVMDFNELVSAWNLQLQIVEQ